MKLKKTTWNLINLGSAEIHLLKPENTGLVVVMIKNVDQ